jgi:hypothetical protein
MSFLQITLLSPSSFCSYRHEGESSICAFNKLTNAEYALFLLVSFEMLRTKMKRTEILLIA